MSSRRHPLKKADRMQQARHWIASYTGKNIVKGYRKRFKVDPLCAAYELQILGIQISESQIQQLKRDEENRRKQNEKRRQRQELQSSFPCSDGYFYFIAGYTSGGAPYGITWEEMGLEPFAEIGPKSHVIQDGDERRG